MILMQALRPVSKKQDTVMDILACRARKLSVWNKWMPERLNKKRYFRKRYLKQGLSWWLIMEEWSGSSDKSEVPRLQYRVVFDPHYGRNSCPNSELVLVLIYQSSTQDSKSFGGTSSTLTFGNFISHWPHLIKYMHTYLYRMFQNLFSVTLVYFSL